MSGAFTANMGAEAMATQLNAMRDELVARFAANEEGHKQPRTATEATKKIIDGLETEVSDLRALQATTQLNLSATTGCSR
jgi:hypothetical protein